MQADPHALGQRIASLRHAHGWSQRRLAEAAGVSHGYVALLELGRLPSPGKFRLDAIAHALNLRTSDALLTAAPAAHVELPSPHAVGTPWHEQAEPQRADGSNAASSSAAASRGSRSERAASSP